MSIYSEMSKPAVHARIHEALDELLGQKDVLYREFPWRTTKDPWRILVSEIMLQQTQTNRVVPKYNEWFEKLPDVGSCASASKTEILALWSGLGYNSRALRLQQCARCILEKHEGRVPDTLAELKALPGIGDYTSGAVAAFAFGKASVFLETNIRTAVVYWLSKDGDFKADEAGIADGLLSDFLTALMRKAMDRRVPVRDFYYALMDFGAYIKKNHGNLSAYCKNYSRQSAFAGSVRQVRGAVIKAITKDGRASKRAMTALYGPDRTEQAVSGLVAEGVVSIAGDCITLSD